MDKRQFNELLEKYLAGKCSKDEERLLHEFYDSFQKDTSWNTKLGPEEKMKLELQESINKRIQKEEKGTPKIYSLQFYMRVAAVLILVTFIGMGGRYIYLQKEKNPLALTEKATQPGQKSTLVLSDGTQIRLNSMSKITFLEEFSDKTREVFLEGEAFFDVAHNETRPFIIRTGGLTTQVLGTSFNVKAFPGEEIEVTVATGKVQVSRTTLAKSLPKNYNENTTESPLEGERSSVVYLVPNEQATFSPATGIIEKHEVKLDNYLAWKEGIIQFDNVELGDAVKTLERWYGVTITFQKEKTKHCRIQGSYKDENLFNILRSFQYILGIEARMINGNEIIINGECNSPQTNTTNP